MTVSSGICRLLAAIEKRQKRLQIILKDNADPQQLLVELVNRVRVRSFEVQVPTLHEIFIKLVSARQWTEFLKSQKENTSKA